MMSFFIVSHHLYRLHGRGRLGSRALPEVVFSEIFTGRTAAQTTPGSERPEKYQLRSRRWGDYFGEIRE